MDVLHVTGVHAILWLQTTFKDQSEWMLIASHLGDPRNAFLIYFPIAYCLHKPTGEKVLWIACLSEWINAVLKWILHGERPYWWIKESDNKLPSLNQYRLTCETGPGSPSGHAMVTAAVLCTVVFAYIRLSKARWYKPWCCWICFALMMLAAGVSRCYIATHFPHQVVAGTLTGVAMAMIFLKVALKDVSLKTYILLVIFIPVSSVLTSAVIRMIGLDPDWSIAKAMKWCAESQWVHPDTQPYNAVQRDAGSLLGYGIFVSIARSSRSFQSGDSSNLFRLVHIILSLLIAQVIENIKPKVSTEMYYLITFLKFGLLVNIICLIPLLIGRRKINSDKNS
ncbi:hypothetical protein ACJMK2_022158 [Sinanodonta woodiana]|uniref:glucose-6-phosphatase n=1 Tax=Sinanodonta woodiana TaxID=1069815 RepID=A0ABD3TK29_SINWO